MVLRKPVLLIDDGENSKLAIEILEMNKIKFVKYDVKNFEDNCCVDLPTTQVPALIAPEGVFRDLEGVKEYLGVEKNCIKTEPDESAYW